MQNDLFYITKRSEVLDFIKEKMSVTSGDIFWHFFRKGEKLSRSWILKVLHEFENKGRIKSKREGNIVYYCINCMKKVKKEMRKNEKKE